MVSVLKSGLWGVSARNWRLGLEVESEAGPALQKILDDAWAQDIRYLSNQDQSANARVDQWANGMNPSADLDEMMAVRCSRTGPRGWSSSMRSIRLCPGSGT